MDKLLQSLANLLKQINVLLPQLFPRSNNDVPVISLPMNQNGYLWNNSVNARHSVRVICDEMGLTYTPTEMIDGKLYSQKDIITACVHQESNFNNNAVNRNRNKEGVITSSDWGLVQVNDFFNIGPGKYWSSVKQVVDNPDRQVKWMITLYKQGKLNLWSSYKTGAFKQWLPK